jgi:predicted  nucleic acid-binding Zn-ribbon protein
MSLHEKLYQLFLLDQQVRGLSTRLNAAKNRLKAQKTKLDQLNQQHHELAEQVKHVSAKTATLEGEANDIEQRIQLIRTRMNSVTNNKEYSAMLVEVNTIKIDKSKKEEEAIAQMEQRERLSGQLKELDAKLADQKKLVTVAEKEVVDRTAEVGQKLAEVTSQRDAASTEVPADALLAFNKAANNHDGEALAVVVEESRKHHEYSCGGCYMSIPVERLNSLMTRHNTLTSCPNCGRILYVADELRTSLSPVK